MKKVLQKRKIKVIQKEVCVYFCDYCKKKFKKGEKKHTWCNILTPNDKHFHLDCEKKWRAKTK